MTRTDRLVLWATFGIVWGQALGTFIFHATRYAVAYLP
jgi:hypothetical protein